MSYALKTAIAGLWHEKWINVLCSFTIAAGLLLISLAAFTVFNVHIATQQIPNRFSVMIFLKDSVKERPGELINQLRGIEGVKNARYISNTEAFRDLKAAINDPDLVLDDLEENPLPSSIELKLRNEYVTTAEVARIAASAAKFSEVDDVHFASNLLRVIQAIRRYTGGLGLGLMLVLTGAVLFVSYSTVKILLYRKLDEINTLKYLGATKSFIRAPFLMEGAFIGMAAGFAALAALVLFHTAMIINLGGHLPVIKTLVLPLAMLPAIPVAGLIVGITGAYMAVGKIRF